MRRACAYVIVSEYFRKYAFGLRFVAFYVGHSLWSPFFFPIKKMSCKYFRYSELYLFGEKPLISVNSVSRYSPFLCSFDCIAPRKVIRIPESGILLLGVQNPSNDWNSEFGIHIPLTGGLESNTWNPKYTAFPPCIF